MESLTLRIKKEKFMKKETFCTILPKKLNLNRVFKAKNTIFTSMTSKPDNGLWSCPYLGDELVSEWFQLVLSMPSKRKYYGITFSLLDTARILRINTPQIFDDFKEV